MEGKFTKTHWEKTRNPSTFQPLKRLMSSVSQEEKNRILRERRQAKMAKGQASQRLNTILKQGSSLNHEATLALDKPQSNLANPDSDPEIQDVSSVSTPDPDMDAIFSSVFGQALGNQPNSPNDPVSEMMKTMLLGLGSPDAGSPLATSSLDSSSPVSSPQQQYDAQLAVYSAFQHKRWRLALLMTRYTAVLVTFLYYYTSIPHFSASPYSMVRSVAVQSGTTDFFSVFTAMEILFTSTYYVVGSRNGWFSSANLLSLIMKAFSFGQMVLPQLQAFGPYLEKVLAYYTLLGMVVGDMSLVIVLFGLLSYR